MFERPLGTLVGRSVGLAFLCLGHAAVALASPPPGDPHYDVTYSQTGEKTGVLANSPVAPLYRLNPPVVADMTVTMEFRTTLQKRFAEVRELLSPVLRANWDEPPLLMYAISCLQTGTDSLDIRYIKKQAERYEAMPGFPETMPRVVTREDAIAAGYYALSRRESGRFPMNVDAMGEAHRLLPKNVYIAMCYAGSAWHGLGGGDKTGAATPEWAANVLKSVLPYAHGKMRTRLAREIHGFDPTFRDGNS